MYSRCTGMPTLGRETEAQRQLCSPALSQGSERQKRGRVPNSSFTVCVRGLISLDHLQPFSQKSRTATVPKVFQIGLCGVVEAYLEIFCNSWSSGFLGERLYVLFSTFQLSFSLGRCNAQTHKSRLNWVWPSGVVAAVATPSLYARMGLSCIFHGHRGAGGVTEAGAHAAD